MNKIKLVYDWYGPNYPIVNNTNDLKKAIINGQKSVDDVFDDYEGLYALRTLHIFKDCDDFEYASVNQVEDNDYFLYEVQPTSDTWYNLADEEIIQNLNIDHRLLYNIRYINGYILCDMSNISTVDPAGIFPRIHNFFNSKMIPTSKVILILGYANIESIYEQWVATNKRNSNENLTVISTDWTEYTASRELNKKETLIQRVDNFHKIQKDFLCYNNRYKGHRVDLLTLFYKFNLLKNSMFSFPKFCKDHKSEWSESYKGYYRIDLLDPRIFIKSRTIIKKLAGMDDENIESLNSLLPLVIDTNKSVQDFKKIIDPNQSLYDMTLLSLVTETRFYLNNIFNTEKIYKPIANRHPFIIVGPAKTLQNLRNTGYKTFSDYFDESYDDIEDPVHRMLKITSLCRAISAWPRNKKENFYYDVMHITEHNYNLLKSIYKYPRKSINILKNRV
jgi:hypothetical protein